MQQNGPPNLIGLRLTLQSSLEGTNEIAPLRYYSCGATKSRAANKIATLPGPEL